MSMQKFMTKPPPKPPILVDSREAARLLSISPRKLWELTKSGEIPSLRIGRAVRYRMADIEAWTERQAATAAPELER
jgi:excisionase family DNA binding protein